MSEPSFESVRYESPADGVARVEEERAALDLREEVGREVVDHPLADADPREREEHVEEARRREEDDGARRDPEHRARGGPRAGQGGEEPLEGRTRRLRAEDVVDQDLQRPGLEEAEPREGEAVDRRVVRYRTVGDMSCTGAVLSPATTNAEIVAEVAASTLTERGATRADDRLSEAAMEDRKKEGYF